MSWAADVLPVVVIGISVVPASIAAFASLSNRKAIDKNGVKSALDQYNVITRLDALESTAIESKKETIGVRSDIADVRIDVAEIREAMADFRPRLKAVEARRRTVG